LRPSFVLLAAEGSSRAQKPRAEFIASYWIFEWEHGPAKAGHYVLRPNGLSVQVRT